MNRPTPDQLTQLDLIHTETGVSAVALSPEDLAMLARYVVGVIAQNDRLRDVKQLLDSGLLDKDGAGGRSTAYLLNENLSTNLY